MNADFALDIGKQALILVLLLGAPMLLLGLAVGVTISILQSVTQIQEMTLTFVPKIVVVVLSLIFFGPWMLRLLTNFSLQLFERLPDLAR
ncbi:MAG TPA: flagellar biosynthesis protein FliQ [bacterium]|jgi:flagellar biosynthetic protein FliQ|nr:flagellar biosynthesis protein FliQ [bacterium]